MAVAGCLLRTLYVQSVFMARSDQGSIPQYLAFPSPYALLDPWVPNVSSIGDVFIAWQCRLRQKAIRQQGGRPLLGMRPRLMSPDGREIAPFITVLLVEKEPEATTDLLRHIIRKTQDPRQRYEECECFHLPFTSTLKISRTS